MLVVKRLRMERDIQKSRGVAREGTRIDSRRGYAFMKVYPVHRPACSHVPGAGSLPQRLLRLGAAPAFDPGAARPMAAPGSMWRCRTRASA